MQKKKKKHRRLLKFNSFNYLSKFYNGTVVLHRSWAGSYQVRHNFMLTSRTRELSRGRKCYRLKGIDYMTEDVSKLHGKYVQLGEVKLQ